jgi:hypothetical protein
MIRHPGARPGFRYSTHRERLWIPARIRVRGVPTPE